MNTASEFAKSAAKLAGSIITELSKDDQQKLAVLAEKGFKIGISFIVLPGSAQPGEIQLSTIDDYGTHQVMASMQLNIIQHH